MLKRVPLIYDAPRREYGVDLPTYRMVERSCLPVTPKLIDVDGAVFGADPVAVMALRPTVLVELPDDWFDKKGDRLPLPDLRAMYADHPRFGAKAYVPPDFTDV